MSMFTHDIISNGTFFYLTKRGLKLLIPILSRSYPFPENRFVITLIANLRL
uniref:Cytochrome P450 n=1 Tax=Schistosoma curassoni TaxID=6186 RepID=A0A183KH94_9TREM